MLGPLQAGPYGLGSSPLVLFFPGREFIHQTSRFPESVHRFPESCQPEGQFDRPVGRNGIPDHSLIFQDKVFQAVADQEEVEFLWFPVVRVTSVGSISISR
eukprot:8017658-Heterocapsa_arctica.AAC.1